MVCIYVNTHKLGCDTRNQEVAYYSVTINITNKYLHMRTKYVSKSSKLEHWSQMAVILFLLRFCFTVHLSVSFIYAVYPLTWAWAVQRSSFIAPYKSCQRHSNHLNRHIAQRILEKQLPFENNGILKAICENVHISRRAGLPYTVGLLTICQ